MSPCGLWNGVSAASWNYFFPGTKEQCCGKVGARYVRKMRHSEADKGDKDNCSHMQKSKDSWGWDKGGNFGASKMTEPWEGRRERWFTITFERHWLEYLLACYTLLGLGRVPLFSDPFPRFKAVNRKRTWKMAMDAWAIMFESEPQIRPWLWETEGLAVSSGSRIIFPQNLASRGNGWFKH